MMQNGNEQWYIFILLCLHLEFFVWGCRINLLLIGKNFHAFIRLRKKSLVANSYYGNYTTELAKGIINSTMVCKILGK